MRIWGLGLRNCLREFSGTCVPLSGRSRPPKNPATGNWESEPGKTFRDCRRGIFHYLGLQAEELWAKFLHGFPCFVDCENWEEQLSNFWRTTKNESIVLFFAFKKLLSCSPVFPMYRGLLLLLHCQKPGRFPPEAFKDFMLKEETVASRTVLCLLRGWCCFRLGNRAFGLGIFNMFCHYTLSSGGLVGRFYPMVQLASAIHLAAGGSLSRLRFERLWTCSFQPRSKVPPQDRQFWPPKLGSKSKAQNQAAFIGLHCAVPAQGRWIATDGRPTQAMRQCQSTGM